jgi:hypothetical protein
MSVPNDQALLVKASSLVAGMSAMLQWLVDNPDECLGDRPANLVMAEGLLAMAMRFRSELGRPEVNRGSEGGQTPLDGG